MSAAAKPISVYTGTDFYVPHFDVTVGNRRQSGAVVRDVMQVTYKDSLDSVDSFEMTVNNWDAERRKFNYHDRHLFDPGQPVVVDMGYLGAAGGGVRTMIRGDITELRVAFPAGGQPTLVVCGLNVLHRFRNEQRAELYKKSTYTDIVPKVCGRHDVPVVADRGRDTVVHEAVKQDNEFDLVFLLRLAHLAGYDLVVTEAAGEPAVAFGPPSPTAKPTYELYYGRTLIEFQPKLSFAHQVDEVAVRGWDPVKGEAIAVTVGGGALKGKLKRGSANPAKGRKEVVGNHPVRDAQAARELAKATLTRIQNEAVTATGSVVGLPDVRAGTLLAVGGVGARFNGRYFVTGTTHTIGSSGYTTQFECRLEELSHKTDGESLADGGPP